MLGYHPAFLLSNSGTETLQTTTAKITLKEVLEAGSNAYPVLNCTKIELKNIKYQTMLLNSKNNNLLPSQNINIVNIDDYLDKEIESNNKNYKNKHYLRFHEPCHKYRSNLLLLTTARFCYLRCKKR